MRYAAPPYRPLPTAATPRFRPPTVAAPAPVPPSPTVYLPPETWTQPIQINLTLVPPPLPTAGIRPVAVQPPPLPLRPAPPAPEPRRHRARRLVLEVIFLVLVLSAITLGIVLLHGIGFNIDYLAPVEFIPEARTP